jgi:quinol monooxygenase YgiN
MVQKVVEVSPADVAEFTSIATILPVRKWRHVVAFLRMSGRIEQQLRRTEGVVRYGLKTDLPRKRFWTYSVWKNPQAIGPFVAAEPHATAVKKFTEWAGEGAAFVEWQGADGKVDWQEAARRLKSPTYYYRK